MSKALKDVISNKHEKSVEKEKKKRESEEEANPRGTKVLFVGH
jgi:hypothetical protein